MRTLLLWLLLLPAAGPVAAQAAPPALPAPAAATPPDTVAALHRLFAARREQRAALAVGALGVGGLSLGAATKGPTISEAGPLLLTGLLTIPAGLGGLLCYQRYSRPAEAQAVADFQAHQLPPWLRRRLRPRHFRAPRVRAGSRPRTLPRPTP